MGETRPTSRLMSSVLPVELTPAQVRPVAYRVLSKKHGLNLKSGGLETLATTLGHKFGVDWRSARAERFLDQIARAWKQADQGVFVDSGDALSAIIRDILNLVKEDSATVSTIQKSIGKPFAWQDYFRVIDAQAMPYYVYNASRKHFDVSPVAATILGPVEARTAVFSTRYHLVADRLSRNESFQPVSFNAKSGARSSYTITAVKNLLGRDGSAFLLLGLLVTGADGNLWLEDMSGRIRLDVSQAVGTDGSYYVPGSFVFCDGVYGHDMFTVAAVGPPVAERRIQSQEAFGHVDFLGLHSNGPTKRIERIDRAVYRQLQAQEKELADHRIIALGLNLFLDQLPVQDALRALFAQLTKQYEAEPSTLPICIVLFGSFVSTPFQANGSSTHYKDAFDLLATLMAQFPVLFHADSPIKLVFVPGDNDPWAASFSAGSAAPWPLQAIPQSFTTRVRRATKSVSFTSNPSRIAYLSQEIVLVRDDYSARFRRNEVLLGGNEIQSEVQSEVQGEAQGEKMQIENDVQIDNSQGKDSQDSDSDDEANQRALSQLVGDTMPTQRSKPYVSPGVAEARKLVKTLLDQGHLSPFPLVTRPVIWAHDHTLTLAPLPTAMFVADATTSAFSETYEGCRIINPGRFLHHNRASWVEYYPNTGESVQRSLYI